MSSCEQRPGRRRVQWRLPARLLSAALLVASSSWWAASSLPPRRSSEAFAGHVRGPGALHRFRRPRRAAGPGGPPPPGQAPGSGQQDPMDLFKQLMSGQQGAQGQGFGGQPGAGGAAGMPENPLAALLGGGAGGKKKETTDGWFTQRIPLLQKLKRPVLIAFFAYSYSRGWVEKWGAIFGCMAGSYFDMLAVPMRVLPQSPSYGKAYFVAQIYVQYFFQFLGYVINVAKGKSKFPPDFSKMFTPPGAGAAGKENPFGAGGGLGQNPFGAQGSGGLEGLEGLFGSAAATVDTAPVGGPASMPTAPTVGPPPVQPAMPTQMPASTPPPPRKAAPVIDADVTFLD